MREGSIQNLLKATTHQIAVLKDSEQRFSRELAPNFAMFEAFRFDEMTLTRCIGQLLDPSGAHGQGALFLEEFLKRAGLKDIPAQACKARVSPEAVLAGGRRIDLLLELDAHRIGIENKPWAEYQHEQLADYSSELESFPDEANWTLICLAQTDPPEYAITSEKRHDLELEDKFKRMDFQQIEQWLIEVAPNVRALSVRVYVEELSKFIRRHINGGLDMAEIEEIEQLLEDKDNLDSAMAIVRAWPDIRKQKLTEFKKQLKDLWRKEWKDYPRADLIWEDKMDEEGRESGFGFTLNRSQIFVPYFSFEIAGLSSMYWGVSTISGEVLPEYKAAAQEVYDLMNTEFGYEGRFNKWWVWWVYAGRAPLEDHFYDWNSSSEPWIQIESGELAKVIIEISSRVCRALEKYPELINGKSMR